MCTAHLGAYLVAVAQVGAGHQVGLYPVVDLQRTLGLHAGRLHVAGVVLGALGQQLAHHFLHVAVDHPLPAVHDRVDEVVAAGDEPVFHVNGIVVPVHDPRRYGVQAERPDELAVPDVGAALHRQPALLPDGLPQAGPGVELGPGEVHLAQIPRVVHVEQQKVHVRGQARGRVRGRVQHVHVLLEQRAHGRAPERPGEIVHFEHPVQQHQHQQHGHRGGVHVALEQTRLHIISGWRRDAFPFTPDSVAVCASRKTVSERKYRTNASGNVSPPRKRND